MIEIHRLTKRYGSTLAVDDLSFDVQPGHVTALLGSNGAGKSTTLRMVLGLDAPDDGHALVNGSPYASMPWPLWEVGTLLDAGAVHPGRSARGHLLCIARSNRIRRDRVDEVLDLTGLSSVATKRVSGFSLGMRQRLGIAAALLGDPGVLILDEPVNGLDPEGIQWIRGLLRSLGEDGRTVLVSSHLMSEMELTADHLVVIGRGRLIADTGMNEFLATCARSDVFVRSPRIAELITRLSAQGATVVAEPGPESGAAVTGLGPEEIALIASAANIPVFELTQRRASLEQAYLHLTDSSVQYRAGNPAQDTFAKDLH
jgi:ABC-2 type transport system ATP-binding protein